jgi:probable rRNA maturation factor
MLTLTIDDAFADALTAAQWRRLRTELGRMVKAAGRAEAAPKELEVSLWLTGDPEIRQLNRDYRRKDRPTDVLAFAQREGEGGALHPEILGDLIISVTTARRQAKRGLLTELLFLSSHGLCHLLGYDHRDDAEEAEMNARMRRLLAEGKRRGRVKAA